MRGVCTDSVIDAYYTMYIGHDQTVIQKELLGFKQTKLAWSDESKRWLIINLVDNSLLAHCNSTTDYPFGSRRWFFTNISCSDAGQSWRKMSLQQKVKQPGHICCDDGVCVCT